MMDLTDKSGNRPTMALTQKFRGINPQLPVDRIAAVALNIEHHSVRELIDLLAPARSERSAA